MAGEQDKEAPAPGHKRKSGTNGGGTQLKSPEKKKRKPTAQAAQFSHLSEFAPPPTPMVDHLVASNPFDDDFAPLKGAVGAPGPFFGNPAPYAGFRPQSAIPPHLHPAFSPGPQPLRRQHFAANPQLAGGFGMPQNPGFAQPGGMNFGGPPFAQGFSPPPPPGQPLHPGAPSLGPGGPVPGPGANFNPMMPPNMGQPPPGPGLNPSAVPQLAQKFVQVPGPFAPSPAPRPNQSFVKGPAPQNHPANSVSAASFPSPDRGFPPPEDGAKTFSRPGNAFSQAAEHAASPAAVNGNPAAFVPAGGTRAADVGHATFPQLTKNPAAHRPPSDPVYPCGFCLNEVNDDQDAILCEASCQKWFHRECTGMTETAYGLLTTETAAVWACDFCLKTKEIQSVYLRENLGQPTVADG
ncbi:pygopus homolog 2 [Rhinoraja longicauda]